MRNCLSVFLLAIFFGAGCHKPGEDSSNIDYTPIPASTNVSTRIIAHILSGSPTPDPGSVYLPGVNLTYRNFCFYTNLIQTDRYQTQFKAGKVQPLDLFLDNARVVPITAASRNYVDTRLFEKYQVGFINPCCADYWDLPGGGKLEFQANSFSTPTSTGFAHAFASYVDPTLPECSILLPSLTADIGDKRMYLQSFGAMIFDLDYPWVLSPVADIKLTIPIPASMLVQAPDSIEAWYFNNYKWEKKGYAKKTNGNFIKKIDKEGLWAFAVSVKGVYSTINIKTEAGSPLINSRIRIINQNKEITSGRTDSNGDFVSFIPTGVNLDLQILNGLSNVFTKNVGVIQNSNKIEISVPVATPKIISIKGTITNCNSIPLSSGYVVINSASTNVEAAHIDIKNGQYNAAIVTSNSSEVAILKIFDDNSNALPGDSAVLLFTGKENVFNLRSCPQPTFLFVSFTVDGTTYSITGDAAHPFTPFLAGYTNSGTFINCSNGNTTGIQFSSIFATAGIFPNAGISSRCWINGTFYSYDFTKPSKIIFTRYDLIAGGYIEGIVDFFYNDLSNVSRHLIANFRVKKIV